MANNNRTMCSRRLIANAYLIYICVAQYVLCYLCCANDTYAPAFVCWWQRINSDFACKCESNESKYTNKGFHNNLVESFVAMHLCPQMSSNDNKCVKNFFWQIRNSHYSAISKSSEFVSVENFMWNLVPCFHLAAVWIKTLLVFNTVVQCTRKIF